IFACRNVRGDLVAEPFEIGSPWHRFSNAWYSPNGLLYTTNPFQYLLIFNAQDGYRLHDSIPFPLRAQGRAPVAGSDDLFLGTRQGPKYFSFKDREIRDLPFIQHSGDIVYSVVPYSSDAYLLTGTNGIYTVDLHKETAVRYDVSHGIGMLKTNPYATALMSDGRVCFGNNQGITLFRPRDQTAPGLPVAVHFTGIAVNGPSGVRQISDDLSRNPDLIESIKLHHRESTISLSFSSVSYQGLDRCSYEYRLAGMDQDWIDGGTSGSARYVHLPPADYRFEVRVHGRPESLRSIAISVIPPFYATTWFIVLCVCLLLSLIYYLQRLRLQRKQKLMQLQFEKQLAVERERVRISNNLHDDLGSSLSALHLRAEGIARQSKDPTLKSQAVQLAAKTGQLVRQIRETIWTTNAAYDTLDNLISHLHQYAQEFFEGHAIEVSTELPATVDASPIPGMHRRQLFLVYKEALHNVLKHARATRVYVAVRLDNGMLQVAVRDDGIGFDPDDAVNGSGLGSMRQRMTQIGGTFDVRSDPDGTVVTLGCPL
ncbi:MAG: triple tyrosine motif-containing protein, partial [Saprospiraceae bacterium]|nr:triple tyrosine motif-containing protein [Saprospiraceae bacterium]